MTVLVNLGKLLTGLVSIKLLHPCLTVSAVTVQVNLGKLLTGLGSCELLHPQNSVLGATVSRLALSGLGVEVTESSTNKQHHLSIVCRRRMRLSGEVLELKKGQRAPQHQLQPPPHRLRSRHVVCFTRTMYLNWRRPARAMPQNWRISRPISCRRKGRCEHSTKHTRHSTRRDKSRCEHSTKHSRLHFQTSTRQRLPSEQPSRSVILADSKWLVVT
jgi:hypothetical protein